MSLTSKVCFPNETDEVSVDVPGVPTAVSTARVRRGCTCWHHFNSEKNVELLLLNSIFLISAVSDPLHFDGIQIQIFSSYYFSVKGIKLITMFLFLEFWAYYSRRNFPRDDHLDPPLPHTHQNGAKIFAKKRCNIFFKDFFFFGWPKTLFDTCDFLIRRDFEFDGPFGLS